MTKALTVEESTKLAKELKLKPKTKQFVDLLLQDPTLSQTEAYLMTHNTTNTNTARSEASKTIAKPSVQLYTQSHINKAKYKIISLVDSEKEEIALKASESILDRELGKSTIKTETNTITDINITLGNRFNKPVLQQTDVTG